MAPISLTIPHEAGPLRRAAEMLTNLAKDYETIAEVKVPVAVEEIEVPLAEEPIEVAEPAATTEAPIVPAGAELDSEELPWDGRIHAASKTKLAKTQAWKLKRNLDATFVETVKAELRALVAPVAGEIATDAIAAVPEVPETPVVTETPVTFETICEKVTARANAQLLLPTDMAAVLAPHGLSDLGALAKRPDLFVAVSAALDTLWAITPA